MCARVQTQPNLLRLVRFLLVDFFFARTALVWIESDTNLSIKTSRRNCSSQSLQFDALRCTNFLKKSIPDPLTVLTELLSSPSPTVATSILILVIALSILILFTDESSFILAAVLCTGNVVAVMDLSVLTTLSFSRSATGIFCLFPSSSAFTSQQLLQSVSTFSDNFDSSSREVISAESATTLPLFILFRGV